MAQELSGCDSVLTYYKSQLNDSRHIIMKLSDDVMTWKDQADNSEKKSGIYLNDNNLLKSDLKSKDKKIGLLRIGIFSISAVGILELGYIAFKK